MYDLIKHIEWQRDISIEAFGPGCRSEGILKHIEKEVEEVRQNPNDLEELIDIILLAIDGAWRRGFTPEMIAMGLLNKVRKNEQRTWPDWRTAPEDEPIEHIKGDD